MSNSKPEPDSNSCWQCPEAEVIKTSTGEMYVVCPQSRWKGSACLAKLLATVRAAPAAVERWVPQWMKYKGS